MSMRKIVFITIHDCTHFLNMFSQTLLLLLSVISFSSQAPLTKRAFSNGPVITADFPDPSFINVGGTYYAFATNNGVQNIQVATSPDFATWTVTGNDALPNIPSWSVPGNVWAPDVVQVVRNIHRKPRLRKNGNTHGSLKRRPTAPSSSTFPPFPPQTQACTASGPPPPRQSKAPTRPKTHPSPAR